jgi:hypothetical protein
VYRGLSAGVGGGGCSEGRFHLGTTEIIALIAVGGTLIGTLGGAILNHFLSKGKEDEARKWESKQRAYEEFTALTLLPDRFHETDEHFEQLARALAGIDLYAAPDVRRAAKRAYNLELERDKHTEESEEEEAEEYKKLDADLEKARGEFKNAARKELGFHPE